MASTRWYPYGACLGCVGAPKYALFAFNFASCFAFSILADICAHAESIDHMIVHGGEQVAGAECNTDRPSVKSVTKVSCGQRPSISTVLEITRSILK